jgi:hypothetical protein
VVNACSHRFSAPGSVEYNVRELSVRFCQRFEPDPLCKFSPPLIFVKDANDPTGGPSKLSGRQANRSDADDHYAFSLGKLASRHCVCAHSQGFNQHELVQREQI